MARVKVPTNTYLDGDVAHIGDVNVPSRLENIQPERVAEPTCPNIIVGIGQRKVRGVVHDGFGVDPD